MTWEQPGHRKDASLALMPLLSGSRCFSTQCMSQAEVQDQCMQMLRASRGMQGAPTASLMQFQVSGTSWSYSSLNARLPGRGAPNVYTCKHPGFLSLVVRLEAFW